MPDDAKPVPVPPFPRAFHFFHSFARLPFQFYIWCVVGLPVILCARGVVLYVRRKMALAAGQRQQKKKKYRRRCLCPLTYTLQRS